MDDDWICLSNDRKIQNPLKRKNIIETYVGNIDNYNFERQKKNYDKLIQLTELCNDKLKYIISVTFQRKTSTATTFIAYNDDKSIVWYKYESLGKTSDNRIYVQGSWYNLPWTLKAFNKNTFRNLAENIG